MSGHVISRCASCDFQISQQETPSTPRVTPPPQAQLFADGGAKSGGDVFAAFEDSSNKDKVGVVTCVGCGHVCRVRWVWSCV